MTTTLLNLDALPAELKADRRWVVARIEVREGKPTKVPHCAFDLRRKASSTDSNTWADFDAAREVLARDEMPMIGYMLDHSGHFGIDLDHCRDPQTGAIEAWATEIIEQIDSYAEVSVSGTGVHIIARGSLPPGRRRTGKDGKHPPVPAGSELETYDSGRYFVMTGVVVGAAGVAERADRMAELHSRLFGTDANGLSGPSSPPPSAVGLPGDDELLRRIRASKQGEKFERLWGGDTSASQGDDSVADLALCSILAFWTRRDRDRIDRLFRQSGLCRQKWGRVDYREATLDRACAITDVYEPTALILEPGDPLKSAREFLSRHHTLDEVQALHYQQGVFYQFDPSTSAYTEREEASIRATLYQFLELARAWDPVKETFGRFKPTKTKIDGVVDALRGICHLPASQAAPCWLRDGDGLNPLELLACQNGLLHIPTRRLYPATPKLFTLNGIDIAYEPTAEAPHDWAAFLASVWPDDQPAIDTLQETVGYYLTPDTGFQKVHLIVGPKRSGKGTIARILRRLIGDRNFCAPTLATFGRDFGKQVLIGKTLAVVSDARISARTDTAMVAEALLSISGEDHQTIPRKFLSDWNGRLGVRFLLLTNELPRVTDTSGAMVSRFIVLVMKQSFYGLEDLGLSERLATALPGILNWALEGRDRLYERGFFVQPPSAKQMVDEFENLSSPVGAFTRECCVEQAGMEVSQDDLFDAWRHWCDDNGREHSGTKQTFGRDLRAALPWLDDVQHREKNEAGEVRRPRYWQGVGLKGERTSQPPAKDLPF